MEKVLVDTCIWIDAFKNKNSAGGQTLSLLIDSGLVVTTGLVVAELLIGLKNPVDRQLLLKHFEPFPYLEPTKQTWITAGEIGASLKQNGAVLPLSDLIIAALVIENNLCLYTVDSHFKCIPNCRLWK